MKSESDKFKETTFESVMKYFGMGMALVYIVGGLAIVIQPGNLFDMPIGYRIPLGICLMLYGAFRSYRVYQKYFQRQ
jgi:hypothetical protein